MTADRKGDRSGEAASPARLPQVPIWKRAQRFAEYAGDFTMLWEAARTREGADRPERAARVQAMGEALASEALAMAGLMKTIAAHPAAPAVAPPTIRKPYKDED